jgi:hypothetical protein
MAEQMSHGLVVIAGEAEKVGERIDTVMVVMQQGRLR